MSALIALWILSYCSLNTFLVFSELQRWRLNAPTHFVAGQTDRHCDPLCSCWSQKGSILLYHAYYYVSILYLCVCSRIRNSTPARLKVWFRYLLNSATLLFRYHSIPLPTHFCYLDSYSYLVISATHSVLLSTLFCFPLCTTTHSVPLPTLFVPTQFCYPLTHASHSVPLPYQFRYPLSSTTYSVLPPAVWIFSKEGRGTREGASSLVGI